MALIDLYREKKIFKKLSSESRKIDYPIPTVTSKPESGILSAPVNDIKKVLKPYYESFPVLNVNFSGQSTEPLITIKPNSSAGEYSTKFDYTMTRADATSKWLKSPNGMKFIANQTLMQTFNPQLETKIYKPNSVLSNLIPFAHYHENRHQTLSSLFGLPINLIGGLAPSTYTEAIWYSDKRSRNIYQSPLTSMGNSESYVGINYANIGRDIMTLPQTWQGINPNRYKFPIGVDGGGLPNSSRITPTEEMNRNIILATQGSRFTKASGFNPTIDAQITINKQKSGTSYLQSLLTDIPFVKTILSFFGYGVLGASLPKIKIFNSYNPTFPYSTNNGHQIRMVNEDGELIDTYDVRDSLESPLERILYAIETGTTVAKEKPKEGLTFAPREEIREKAVGMYDFFEDDRLKKNPQDGSDKLNSYLQSYGDVMSKRTLDQEGTANIGGLIQDDIKKPYSKFIKEDTDARVINLRSGYGFANSGAKRKEDRQGDLINQLEYGEDYPNDGFTDLVPFKFYHVNERKWIIFRASLEGLTDNTTPEWNSKRYIGRADELYTYRGATRKINFSFKVMIHSPQELRPVYEKINYLIGLNYPKYRRFGNDIGEYMEAPFVKLTIGDLFTDVAGIIDGGVTITYPDDGTWEIREKERQLIGNDQIDIAKVPRYIEITVGSFTPFSLDNKPISSTSPFYSMIKKWQ